MFAVCEYVLKGFRIQDSGQDDWNRAQKSPDTFLTHPIENQSILGVWLIPES